MAQVTGGGDGSKLNFDLNLVPFIDLLSSLVLFLLLTVVWVQVAAIQTGVDKGGKAVVTKEKDTKLLINVKANGFVVTWPAAAKGKAYPRNLKKIEEIGGALKTFMKNNKPPITSISGDDKVEFGHVIETLDTLKALGIKLVGISTE